MTEIDTSTETVARLAGYLLVRALTPDDARAALDRMLAEAVAQERERCAKIAEQCTGDDPIGEYDLGWSGASEQIAAAIREGQTP